MPVLQLIGGSVIFLQRLAAGSRLVAPLLALYLAWLILVAGSLAFTRPLLRWPLPLGLRILLLPLLQHLCQLLQEPPRVP